MLNVRRQGGCDIAYRFERDDHDVVDALRRIAAEQVDIALAEARADGDPGPRIHAIRKCTKKLRGLMRLVRPAFPDYGRENAALRDLARTLSGLRDATVTAATLEDLIEAHRPAVDAATFAAVRDEIAGEVPSAPDLAPVAATLAQVRERVALWTLHDTGWDALAGGLRRTYRDARRSRRGKGDEALHAWRKPVKYHWYHVRLLEGMWPDAMAAREATADALGEALGQHQDLVVLQARLAASSLPAAPARVLRGLIVVRKAELEAEARELAPRLLAEKPRALAERWGDMWDAWTQDA